MLQQNFPFQPDPYQFMNDFVIDHQTHVGTKTTFHYWFTQVTKLLPDTVIQEGKFHPDFLKIHTWDSCKCSIPFSREFFICLTCHKMFASRSSIYSHVHTKMVQNEDSHHNVKVQFNEIEAMNKLMDFIAVTDQSLNSITTSVFQDFISILNAHFQIPCRTTLRSNIISYANEIKEKNLSLVKNQFVCIMIDGAKKMSQNFEGAMICTMDKLFFYGVDILQKGDAINIAKFITRIVHELRSVNAIVIAVTCDNATSNIAASKPSHLFFADEINKVNIIRFSCICHTIELGIGYIFGPNGKYSNLRDVILTLLKFCLSHKEDFLGVPHFTERWSSLYICTRYLKRNCTKITTIVQSMSSKKKEVIQVKKAFAQLENNNLTLQCLSKMLKAGYKAIKELEGDFEYIYDIWPAIHNLYNSLQKEEHPLAYELWTSIMNSMMKKDTLGLPLFAYSLLSNGYMFIKTNPNAALLQKACEDAITHYINITHQNEISDNLLNNLLTEYRYFMTSFNDQNAFLLDINYWKEEHNAFNVLRCIALQLFSIPCSEAAVERLFAYLGHAYTPAMSCENIDLINARLTIKYNYFFQHNMPNTSNSTHEMIDYYSNLNISWNQALYYHD